MSVRASAPSHARALTRTSLVSLLATGIELALLPLLIHGLAVPRWISFAGVQLVANAITFFLYKYWAFEAGQVGRLHVQYLRQAVVFGGSLLLNTAIPSWLSYRLGLEPVLSFALSNVAVYLLWNYPGNRYWVFLERRRPS